MGLSLVLQERAKVFVELTKKQTQTASNAKSYQSMNMLEQLLDQEAGRLEHELKQQLRYHTVVEQENKEQLAKEQKLKEVKKQREERLVSLQEVASAKRRTKSASNNAKIDHSRKLLKDIQQEHNGKCADFLSHVLETEVRIREFKKSLEGRNFEKSQAWKNKVENIHRNFEELQENKGKAGQVALVKKEEKIKVLEARRQKETETADL